MGISDGAIIIDLAGLVQFTNPVARALMGLDQTPTPAKHLSVFLLFRPGPTVTIINDLVNRVIDLREVVPFRAFLKKAGPGLKEIAITGKISPIEDHRGHREWSHLYIPENYRPSTSSEHPPPQPAIYG